MHPPAVITMAIWQLIHSCNWAYGYGLLVPIWKQQYVTSHHISNCMGCQKATVMITGTAHDYMISYNIMFI